MDVFHPVKVVRIFQLTPHLQAAETELADLVKSASEVADKAGLLFAQQHAVPQSSGVRTRGIALCMPQECMGQWEGLKSVKTNCEEVSRCQGKGRTSAESVSISVEKAQSLAGCKWSCLAEEQMPKHYIVDRAQTRSAVQVCCILI